MGDHEETFLSERAFAPTPGEWLSDRFRSSGFRRVGVHGLDYVMPVRDYEHLASAPTELVRFDAELDLARAVKSEEELRSVRHSMEINKAGVFAVAEAFEPLFSPLKHPAKCFGRCARAEVCQSEPSSWQLDLPLPLKGWLLHAPRSSPGVNVTSRPLPWGH